jgi:hypothetical protein
MDVGKYLNAVVAFGARWEVDRLLRGRNNLKTIYCAIGEREVMQFHIYLMPRRNRHI